MKSISLKVCLLTAALIALPSNSHAQAPGGDGPGPFGQMMNGLNPANWKLPQMKMPKMQMPKFGQMLPNKQEKQRVIQKKNNLVDEVSQTAKNSWKRTRETLNPMKYLPAGFKQNRTPKPKTKQGGFFQGLFGPREPAPKPASPSEFLSQEKIR